MRILIVDDDEISLELMAHTLRVSGYEVETAEAGEVAWARLQRGGIDLVVTDWMMPGMDGPTLCKRIRDEGGEDYTHVIIVTARDSVNDAVAGLEAGADEFVRKPLSPAELQARVRSIGRLQELNREVAQQNAQLRRSNSLKNDWISMIVHDMRTPLTAIQCACDMLAIKNPKEGRYLDIVQGEAERVNEMLEQMLIMARSEDGHLRISTEFADVGRIVNKACEQLDTVARRKGIALERIVPGEEIRANIDRSLYRRLLDNLLANAVKFSPADSTITVELERSGASVVLSVSDQGPGIPTRDRERIFEKYETVKLKNQGVAQCGLGLAFCRVVAAAHGGRIAHEDVNPNGSRFTVTVPQEEASQEEPKALLGTC